MPTPRRSAAFAEPILHHLRFPRGCTWLAPCQGQRPRARFDGRSRSPDMIEAQEIEAELLGFLHREVFAPSVAVTTYPVLRARPCGLILPQWKLPRRAAAGPSVRVHRDEPELAQRLFNEPLATTRGELARFDLIQRDGGRMALVFTWAHALMDAP